MLASNVIFSLIEPEKVLTFRINWAFGTIDVFGDFATIECSTAIGDDIAANVHDGEHEPIAETSIIAAAVVSSGN